ncbi:hypothetical protein ACVWXM_007995 [Bradyrhizobium sp. GM7.3]
MCQPSASSAIEPNSEPATILADHHDQRQDDDEPGAPLVLVVLLAQEGVVMGPLFDGMGMHRKVSERFGPLTLI